MSVKKGTIIYFVEDNETTPYIVVGDIDFDYIFAIRIVNHGYNCSSHICIKSENIKNNCFGEYVGVEDEFNDFANKFVDNDNKKINKFKKEN